MTSLSSSGSSNDISDEEISHEIALEDSVLLDSWMFSPCGYSLNALIGQDAYSTIHVTPERDYSYASFETNAELESSTGMMAMFFLLFLENNINMRPWCRGDFKECASHF